MAAKFPEPCHMSKNPVYEMVKLRKPKKCGFECDFVDEPPGHIQAKCPLCSRILCEPHQASCCGHSFCRVCAKQIQADKKSCPMCNEDNLDTFHNKRLQRSLYKFQVYCTHRQKGCKWTGELGQLDKHLNLNPQRENQLEGCQYSEIECSYCPEVLQRHILTTHQVYQHHKHQPCPGKGSKFLQKESITKQLSLLSAIDCDFHHVGCDVKLPRKDMPAHLKENLVTHMSLQAASYSKLLASHNELKNRVTKLEQENQLLKNENHRQQQEMTQHTDTDDTEDFYEDAAMYTIVPAELSRSSYSSRHGNTHDIIMHHFQLQKGNNTKWYSKSFYTHNQGYKMCIRVDANGAGEGKGSHVSVCVHLMKGEFDDYLIWPFRGTITVQLLDQERDKEHHSLILHFTDKTPDKYASRVIDRERNIKGWGYAKYISHDKLLPMYLKRDSLHFRVTTKVTP